jgi:hypothetical protein
LTAVALDFGGTLGADSVSVIGQTGRTENAVMLKAIKPGGAPPLTTGFSLSSLVGIQQVALDADGDGTVDFQGSNLDAFTFTYSSPGLYTPHVSVTDANNNLYGADTIVEVADPTAIDAHLQAIWQGVKDALRSGDVATALQYVHSTQTVHYQTLWDQLPSGTLANIDNVLTSIQPVQIGFGNAEYEMLRVEDGQTFSYPVRFELDQDGLWRLSHF